MKISDPLGKVYTHTMFKKRPVSRKTGSDVQNKHSRGQAARYSRHLSSDNDDDDGEEHLEDSTEEGCQSLSAAHHDNEVETEQSDDSLSTGGFSHDKKNDNNGSKMNSGLAGRLDSRRISSVRKNNLKSSSTKLSNTKHETLQQYITP